MGLHDRRAGRNGRAEEALLRADCLHADQFQHFGEPGRSGAATCGGIPLQLPDSDAEQAGAEVGAG